MLKNWQQVCKIQPASLSEHPPAKMSPENYQQGFFLQKKPCKAHKEKLFELKDLLHQSQNKKTQNKPNTTAKTPKN